MYNPPSDAEGSWIWTTLDVAILQARGIERSKSERNDQSEPHPTPGLIPQTPKKRDPYSPRRRSAEIRTGSSTACTVNTSSTPAPARHRTCTPNPCQLASKTLCGSSKAAMPAREGQGRSFRNGVRFSVQTRSAGSVAWRRLCLCGAGNRGRSPVGGKARVGEVV